MDRAAARKGNAQVDFLDDPGHLVRTVMEKPRFDLQVLELDPQLLDRQFNLLMIFDNLLFYDFQK